MEINDEFKRHGSGFYLIGTVREDFRGRSLPQDFYFAFVDGVPKKESTLEEWEVFNRLPIQGAISLSNGFPPQLVDKYGKHFESFDEIGKRALEESELKTDDVYIPFIGGISGFDFRELFRRWFYVEGKSIYDYEQIARQYYKEVFTMIKANLLLKKLA